MRHLTSFMQHEVVLALGWTLIHSLWQGLLLALVTGVMLLATKKSASQKRYEWLTGLFLLFIAVTGMTFARELYLAIAHPGFRPLANIAAGRSVISSIIPFTDSHIVVNRSWVSRLKDYFNQHAYLIVTIWFIIFVARFVKLIGEVAYIQRLKTYRTSEPPEAWKNRLTMLMEKMYIHTPVQFLESAIVKVPVVMGMLKPVILLPLGLLAKLPPDEIEAILLHELAHIRRRDYFVNLVQSFAETLFFFNPAVMWLSSLIREERENCCDDIAIAVTNNKTTFIDALISFQEFDLAKPSFTMGFPGKKHQLLNRVKRIISKKNKTLNTTEKSILTLSMAILIMLSFVAAKNIPVAKIRKKFSFTSVTADTASYLPQEKTTVTVPAREKAATVSSSFLQGYTPVLHETIDTTPATPITPTPPVSRQWTMSGTYQVKTDTLTDFTHYSTEASSNDNITTVAIRATQKNGTQYTLKKINDRVTEFSINGKSIPENEFRNYQEAIEAVERPYESKKIKSEIDKEKNRLQHESDMNKQKIAEFEKEMGKTKTDGNVKRTIKMQLVDGQWIRVNSPDTLNRRQYLQKQQELDKKLSELDKLKENDDVEAKKERLKTLNIQMKAIDSKIAKLNEWNPSREEMDKLDFDYVHRKNDWKTNDSLYKAQKNKTALKKKLDINNKSEEVYLKYKADSLRQALRITEQKLSQVQKQQSINNRNEQDKSRIQLQAIQIKAIASDLEKENVKIDLQKSWFALDNGRFIVDGKVMSREIHQRFKAKYLKQKNTPGYFYGPVQLEGRGVFMEYRDLSR